MPRNPVSSQLQLAPWAAGVFNLLFGIFGFPMGLTLCVVAGADPFTSNCMYVVTAVSEGERLVMAWVAHAGACCAHPRS